MQVVIQAADAQTGSFFFQNTDGNVWEMGRINGGNDEDFFVYNHNLTEFALKIDRVTNRVSVENGDLAVNAGDGAAARGQGRASRAIDRGALRRATPAGR